MKNLLLILLLSGLLIACGEEKEETQDPEEKQEQTLSEAEEDAADTASVAEEDVEVHKKHEHEHDTKEEKKTTTATKGSWTGKVIKITDFIKGSSENLDVNRVKQLINAGQYVGFETNGTFYMVYNAAGNYDWKSLAKAAGKEVTIEGKVKKVGGISIIIADNVAM